MGEYVIQENISPNWTCPPIIHVLHLGKQLNNSLNNITSDPDNSVTISEKPIIVQKPHSILDNGKS